MVILSLKVNDFGKIWLFWILVLLTIGVDAQKVRYVNNINDSGPSSLREVINNSNDGDNIILNISGSLNLQSPLLIDKSLNIQGPMPIHLRLDGAASGTIINYSGTSTSQLTIAGVRFENATSSAIIVNSGGLVLRDCVFVDESANCAFDIPNAFSPDGDGINETWVIPLVDSYRENEVRIFNRWGDELETYRNYNNFEVVWDGTHNGTPVSGGTYFYTIRLAKNNRMLSGWVEITR